MSSEMKICFTQDVERELIKQHLKDVYKILPLFETDISENGFDPQNRDVPIVQMNNIMDGVGKGGRHCIFTRKIEDIGLIIKPYRLSFFEIVHYYYTSLKLEGEDRFRLPKIIALGYFSLEGKIIPFLVQELVVYPRPSNLQSQEEIIEQIKSVFRALTNEGYILDPYADNFAVEGETLVYTDLIFIISREDKIKSRALEEELLSGCESILLQ